MSRKVVPTCVFCLGKEMHKAEVASLVEGMTAEEQAAFVLQVREWLAQKFGAENVAQCSPVCGRCLHSLYGEVCILDLAPWQKDAAGGGEVYRTANPDVTRDMVARRFAAKANKSLCRLVHKAMEQVSKEDVRAAREARGFSQSFVSSFESWEIWLRYQSEKVLLTSQDNLHTRAYRMARSFIDKRLCPTLDNARYHRDKVHSIAEEAASEAVKRAFINRASIETAIVENGGQILAERVFASIVAWSAKEQMTRAKREYDRNADIEDFDTICSEWILTHDAEEKVASELRLLMPRLTADQEEVIRLKSDGMNDSEIKRHTKWSRSRYDRARLGAEVAVVDYCFGPDVAEARRLELEAAYQRNRNGRQAHRAGGPRMELKQAAKSEAAKAFHADSRRRKS